MRFCAALDTGRSIASFWMLAQGTGDPTAPIIAAIHPEIKLDTTSRYGVRCWGIWHAPIPGAWLRAARLPQVRFGSIMGMESARSVSALLPRTWVHLCFPRGPVEGIHES